MGPRLAAIAPGVLGYTMEQPDGSTYIPLIVAEKPGNGDVGRFLDGLNPAQTWKVPNVLNVVLEGMLQRRGFVERKEWAEAYGEWVDVWVRDTNGRHGSVLD